MAFQFAEMGRHWKGKRRMEVRMKAQREARKRGWVRIQRGEVSQVRRMWEKAMEILTRAVARKKRSFWRATNCQVLRVRRGKWKGG